ncbi:unnamed protein product [Lampetra fluviatilis]
MREANWDARRTFSTSSSSQANATLKMYQPSDHRCLTPDLISSLHEARSSVLEGHQSQMRHQHSAGVRRRLH